MLSKVKFEVISGLYCEFINYLIEKEFYLLSITRTEYGFTAICLAGDYLRISKAARKFQCKTKAIKKIGIYFKIKKIIKRKGILTGICLIFLCTYIFSNMIWSIDVIAPTQNITEDVYSLLYKNDIYTGTYFNQDKNQDVIRQISSNVDNVGYVTLNFYKGVLTCKVDQTINRLQYLENQTNGNIVANMDGVIQDLRVYNGFYDLKIGQVVTKGELLVSSTYLDRNGNLQQVMPRAYIEASCIKQYQTQVDFNKTATIKTGNYDKKIVLKFLGKDFTIKDVKSIEYENYDAEKKFEYVKILGFKLPITKEVTTYYEKKDTIIEKNEEQAFATAKKIMDDVIKSDNSLITVDKLEYSQEVTENGVILYCKVYGNYDITK